MKLKKQYEELDSLRSKCELLTEETASAEFFISELFNEIEPMQKYNEIMDEPEEKHRGELEKNSIMRRSNELGTQVQFENHKAMVIELLIYYVG